MLLQLNQLIVPPGHQLLIKDISFAIYQHILAELGENRNSRISYDQGVLEIMAPLPEHETGKVIIGEIRLKDRIDLEVDPPPDLAIEIDITSRTKFDNYQALGVPELWRWNGRKLEINLLLDGMYVESNVSRIFTNIPIVQVIPEYLIRSKTDGRNTTMKAFRMWLRHVIFDL